MDKLHLDREPQTPQRSTHNGRQVNQNGGLDENWLKVFAYKWGTNITINSTPDSLAPRDARDRSRSSQGGGGVGNTVVPRALMPSEIGPFVTHEAWSFAVKVSDLKEKMF
jgi:hypothetical protein